MKTIHEENSTLKGARPTLVNDLTCAEARHEATPATPAGQELGETIVRKPGTRCG